MTEVLTGDVVKARLSSPQGDFGVREASRVAAGAAMLLAGVGHLSFARRGFQAQVPDWVPGDKDVTVLASGVVEVAMGAALIWSQRHREWVGAVLAAFFVAVFPGNIHQYTGQHDALGLNTDRKRFVRLFFQPLMVATAWWTTRAKR